MERSFGFGTTIGLVSTGLISFSCEIVIGFDSSGFSSIGFESYFLGSGTLISLGPDSVGFEINGNSFLKSCFFSSSI